MKAILNVIEMLSSIIKDGKRISDLETELEEQEKQATATRSPTPKQEIRESSSRQRSRSPSHGYSEKDRIEKYEKELDKKQR